MITVREHYGLVNKCLWLSSRAGMSLPAPTDDNMRSYFVYAVKEHLGTLNLEQWESYREQAGDLLRNSDPAFDFGADYSLDELLDNFTSIDQLSVDNLLDVYGKRAVAVCHYHHGSKKLYYVSDAGIWFAESYSGDYLYQFWATYPAYPRGW